MRVEDLYDYDAVRGVGVATVYVARVDAATLVLGGHQSPLVLDPTKVLESATVTSFGSMIPS